VSMRSEELRKGLSKKTEVKSFQMM
jgi:hypothetical protein